MQIIDEAEIRAAVGAVEALSAVEAGFRALAAGRAIQPPPLGMEIPAVRGEVHAKGAYLEGAPIFALKVATGFYENPERGLPVGSGLVLVFDAATGFPLGVLADDGYLTELRTGAAGALAVRHLAPREVDVVAFVGAGTQARYQLRAIRGVRRWRRTRVWSRHRETADAFAEELQGWLAALEEDGGAAPGVQAVASVQEAVEGADVVVTVTPSRRPLVEAGWISGGATVVAVGSDGPEKQELDPALLRRADRVVVDSLDQCLRLGELHHAVEAGIMKADDVHAELGQVVQGGRPGREADRELVVCDLTGVGAQDAAVAARAWETLGRG